MPAEASQASKVTFAGGEWRRREARVPCVPTPVVVWQISPPADTIRGYVIEVSPSGLRVKLEAFIPMGVSVRIAIGETMSVTGQVRHCRQNAIGSFDTGVILDA